MELERLHEYALYVRTTIEYCKENNPLFSDFPDGYCSKASLWLYDYLHNNGYRDMEFRMRDPFINSIGIGNHVWLYYKGFNIDITSDQFNRKGYSFETVYVRNEPNYYYDSYDEITDRKSLIDLEFIGGLQLDGKSFYNKWYYVYEIMGISFNP